MPRRSRWQKDWKPCKRDRNKVRSPLAVKMPPDDSRESAQRTFTGLAATAPSSGSGRVDGGNNVIDTGATNSAVVIVDDDFTIVLNGYDGAEAGMFCGAGRPPFNALPYYRILFR
jgi:hypothetical protein